MERLITCKMDVRILIMDNYKNFTQKTLNFFKVDRVLKEGYYNVCY